MKIALKLTGGMGVTLAGVLTADDLPEEITAAARTRLTAKSLAQVQKQPGNPLQTDVQEYEITLVDGGGGAYRFNETQCSSDLLEFLDALTARLKEKLVEERKR